VKFIVDTNIVFSALLNTNTRTGKVLINSKHHFQFYSCDFLKIELIKHRVKLKKLTKLKDSELEELEQLIAGTITFVNENLIPKKYITAATKLTADIDRDDMLFLALAKYLKAKLWTGDKELMAGLKKKKFYGFITTNEISELLDKLERK
jgi:predicted nucleic acid-binding protein